MTHNSDKPAQKVIYKKSEFEEFIRIIKKEGQSLHWYKIAEIVGVDRDTITAWKELPEAKEAIKEGIANALASMQKVGAKDWRMWEAKLKILGVNPQTNVDITTNGKDIVLPILGGLSKDVQSNNGNQQTSQAS